MTYRQQGSNFEGRWDGLCALVIEIGVVGMDAFSMDAPSLAALTLKQSTVRLKNNEANNYDP